VDRNRGSRFVIALVLVLILPATAFGAKAPKGEAKVPRFVDETASAGVDHGYAGDWQFYTGGGVAVLDCDADGRPDLYLAGGEGPAGLYRNRSEVGGQLAFEHRQSEVTDLTLVTGAYPLDIDSDDIVDLVVLRRGENVLLRGLGDCTFERANEDLGFDGQDDWTTAFSAKWDPGAALPTLVLGDYLTIVEYPEQPACDDSAIYRPSADGRGFGPPESLTPGFCTLSALFSDWDRSGRRDLRLTNDRQYYIDGEDQLWRIEPGQEPSAWTREEGWPKLQVWGMGLASDDITGDGLPEVYISSFADNKLQSLPDGASGPVYENIAGDLGVGVAQPAAGGEHLPSTSWHAEFDDVNNDGRLDLFVAKGNVEAMAENAMKDPSELLVAQRDGSFRRVAKAAGILDFERSRGAALADLNLDGLLDLVEVKRAEPVRILRNVGAGSAARPKGMGHWLGVELAQTGPNTDAIGAWIEVDRGDGTAIREVTVGGGHAGGQLGPMHFGLGSAEQARVRVTWPDGEVGEWLDVDADARVLIERGSAEPVVLSDPAPAG
jgi:enediyne biosynthesis protein E4